MGVLGNVIVITHTIYLNKEKEATTCLIGNLALADLLVCLTFYPIWILEFIQIILNIDNDQDWFCKFSRATVWAFMSASIATLLAITVDRYVFIVKLLRYLQIVTYRRVSLAISAIWITACCLFIVHYVHDKSYGMEIRSVCYISDGIYYFTTVFAGYFPLILIYLFNFHILSVARKQRKRILALTTITSGDRMSFVTGFFVALRQAKTFAIVIAVLTFCILTPTVVEEIVSIFFTDSTYQIWVVFFHYELYGINSVVNAFIYGMRHVRYRKAFQHILFKLFSCHKATK